MAFPPKKPSKKGAAAKKQAGKTPGFVPFGKGKKPLPKKKGSK